MKKLLADEEVGDGPQADEEDDTFEEDVNENYNGAI